MPAWIGQSVKRREDLPLITGRGRYAADGRRPDLVHLAFRRAGVPEATGLRVDLKAALEMPGVLGAWKEGELGFADEHMPDTGMSPPVRRPLLASDRIRYEGEAVAVVAAESAYQAADAIEAIAVEYDEPANRDRPAVETRHDYGDAAAAFEGAPVVVHGRIALAQITGGAIEPRACLAEWNPDEERLVIRATVGWVHG